MKVLRGKAAMIADRNITISSSVIRQLLSEEGKVEQMPRYLTRNYQLSGEVTPGEHIGRQLGFPTANLEPLCATASCLRGVCCMGNIDGRPASRSYDEYRYTPYIQRQTTDARGEHS